MGLFVLKDSSEELLQLSFEEILNEIAEKPKAILAPRLSSVQSQATGPNEERKSVQSAEDSSQNAMNNDARSDGSRDHQVMAHSNDGEEVELINLYQLLRLSFRRENGQQGSLLDFHLDRLKAEFEESHSAAKL